MNVTTASARSFFALPVSQLSFVDTSSLSSSLPSITQTFPQTMRIETTRTCSRGFVGAGVRSAVRVAELVKSDALVGGWLMDANKSAVSNPVAIAAVSVPAAKNYAAAINAHKCRPLSRCGPQG
jgi:hypothetical protein